MLAGGGLTALPSSGRSLNADAPGQQVLTGGVWCYGGLVPLDGDLRAVLFACLNFGRRFVMVRSFEFGRRYRSNAVLEEEA